MRIRRLVSIIFLNAIILPIALGRAQDATSAKAFLRSVFQHYENHGNGIELDDPRYFHSTLIALVKADLKAAKVRSEIPIAGDADLVCDCQEWDGFWVLKMNATVTRPGWAEAIVTFSVYETKSRSKDDLQTFRYSLITERGQWRIYDIDYLSYPTHSGQPKSLRKQIQRDIEAFKQDSK